MPSKLSFHLSGYTGKTFDMLERVQPSIVKVYNMNSEMNIDEIRRRCGALIVYREVADFNFHDSADAFFGLIQNSVNKLRGRGIFWEGVNEPVPDTIDDAKALNKWIVRFAEIMHSQGELVAGFSWSTGNPTDAKWDRIVPYMVEAAAAVDLHSFHEYYSPWALTNDWGRYRKFETRTSWVRRFSNGAMAAGPRSTSRPSLAGLAITWCRLGRAITSRVHFLCPHLVRRNHSPPPHRKFNRAKSQRWNGASMARAP